ncbi:hypothetical protein F5Y15DRAFT_172900 [Xylariaceae sp. FL0016]|nr:hypothetical protein F5Y15DRAFT_172900 [Xylariaceae sp. FL0016]
MDFVGGELALLNQGGRSSVATDPLEFFVKTLSASPNSRTLYAEQLLRFATETGSGFKTALSPALSYQSTNSRTSSSGTESSWSGGRTDSTWSAVGTIVGEVAEEADADDTIAPLDLNGEPLANEESMIDELISSGLGVGAYHHQASSMNFGFGTGTGADAKDTTDYGMGLRSGLGLGMGMGLYTGNSGINNTNNASTTAAATTNNTTALDDSIPSRFAGPRVPWSEYGYGGFSSGSETERGGGLHTGSVCVPAPFPVVLPHIGTAQTLGSAEKTRMDDHRARVPRHPSGVMGGAW